MSIDFEALIEYREDELAAYERERDREARENRDKAIARGVDLLQQGLPDLVPALEAVEPHVFVHDSKVQRVTWTLDNAKLHRLHLRDIEVVFSPPDGYVYIKSGTNTAKILADGTVHTEHDLSLVLVAAREVWRDHQDKQRRARVNALERQVIYSDDWSLETAQAAMEELAKLDPDRIDRHQQFMAQAREAAHAQAELQAAKDAWRARVTQWWTEKIAVDQHNEQVTAQAQDLLRPSLTFTAHEMRIDIGGGDNGTETVLVTKAGVYQTNSLVVKEVINPQVYSIGQNGLSPDDYKPYRTVRYNPDRIISFEQVTVNAWKDPAMAHRFRVLLPNGDSVAVVSSGPAIDLEIVNTWAKALKTPPKFPEYPDRGVLDPHTAEGIVYEVTGDPALAPAW